MPNTSRKNLERPKSNTQIYLTLCTVHKVGIDSPGLSARTPMEYSQIKAVIVRPLQFSTPTH